MGIYFERIPHRSAEHFFLSFMQPVAIVETKMFGKPKMQT